MAEDPHPPDLVLSDHVLDIAFHPAADVVACSQLTGEVNIFQYSDLANSCLASLSHHDESTRSVEFSPSGAFLCTGSKDKSIAAVDSSTGKVVKLVPESHDTGINALKCFGEHFMASGDDDGTVKIWDFRQQDCVMTFEENEDFIADMEIDKHGEFLLTPSGDGTLSVLNLKKGKLQAMSDNFEDELLSVCILKNGKKVAVGSQEGIVNVFKWDWWGDCKDRFIGHPNSIDTMVKIDEDTMCTGSSDGLIRIVQIQPNKLLGVIGEHEDFPVERLALSRDKRLLGSCSHDNSVKFWNVAFLYEEDEDGEKGEGEEEQGDGDMDTSDEEEKKAEKKKAEKKKAEKKKAKGKGKIAEKPSSSFFSDL